MAVFRVARSFLQKLTHLLFAYKFTQKRSRIYPANAYVNVSIPIYIASFGSRYRYRPSYWEGRYNASETCHCYVTFPISATSISIRVLQYLSTRTYVLNLLTYLLTCVFFQQATNRERNKWRDMDSWIPIVLSV